MNLHEKIYYCRRRAGLSQDALAEAVGVSRQAVSKWELGDAVPETANLAALAAALGVSVDWLLSSAEPELEPEAEPDAGDAAGGSGAEAAQGRAPDWIEHLPRYMQSAARRWGWLAGVYLALSGIPLVIIGTLARVISNNMMSSFGDFSGGLWGGGFGSTVIVDGVEIPISGASQPFNPVAALGTAIIVIGAAMIIGGAALAVFLKRRSR